MDYSQFTRSDLDNLAQARGLDSSGSRAVVTQRLLEYDRAEDERISERERADALAATDAGDSEVATRQPKSAAPSLEANHAAYEPQ